MTIIKTVSGADRNMPGMPQITPQIANEMRTTSDERLSDSPIIRG